MRRKPASENNRGEIFFSGFSGYLSHRQSPVKAFAPPAFGRLNEVWVSVSVLVSFSTTAFQRGI